MSQATLVERYRGKLLALEPREYGFHVTSLVYSCVRRCYFNVTEEPHFDQVTRMKLNIGQVVHKAFRLEDATHELKLTWDGIVGSLDVYSPETGELLDLKTIYTPSQYIKELPYPHHRTQVEYYCLLLAKNNLRVGPATVLYVPINVAKTIEVRPISEIEAEVAAKVKAVKQGQETKIPPPGLLKSRECRFCPHLGVCDEAEKAKEVASS